MTSWRSNAGRPALWLGGLFPDGFPGGVAVADDSLDEGNHFLRVALS